MGLLDSEFDVVCLDSYNNMGVPISFNKLYDVSIQFNKLYDISIDSPLSTILIIYS